MLVDTKEPATHGQDPLGLQFDHDEEVSELCKNFIKMTGKSSISELLKVSVWFFFYWHKLTFWAQFSSEISGCWSSAYFYISSNGICLEVLSIASYRDYNADWTIYSKYCTVEQSRDCEHCQEIRLLPSRTDYRHEQTAVRNRLPSGTDCRQEQTAVRKRLPSEKGCRPAESETASVTDHWAAGLSFGQPAPLILI